MRAPECLPIQATADAMASQDMAGFGGVAHFANGISAWFQLQLSLAETQQLWPWVGSNIQKHTAASELLAQFALTFAIESHLPRRHLPHSVPSRLRQQCS